MDLLTTKNIIIAVAVAVVLILVFIYYKYFVENMSGMCPEGYTRSEMSVSPRMDCYVPEKDFEQGWFVDLSDSNIYKCPEGMLRTLEPVQSSKACSSGMFGPFAPAIKIKSRYSQMV